MKALLLNMFLNRGAGVVTEIAGKAVRHGTQLAAGWLAAHGVAAGDDLSLIAAGAMAVVSLGISVARAVLPKLVDKL